MISGAGLPIWSGEQGFYYSRYPKPGTVAPEDEVNYNQVYWHTLSTPQDEDTLVYDDPQAKELSFSPFLTADEDYLLLHVRHGTDPRNGLYVQKPGEVKVFVHLFEPGEASYTFLGNDGSRFYLLTDLAAPKGRIVAVELDRPSRENWVEVLPEGEDVIAEARYLHSEFVVSFMHNVQSVLRIYGSDGEFGRIPYQRWVLCKASLKTASKRAFHRVYILFVPRRELALRLGDGCARVLWSAGAEVQP